MRVQIDDARCVGHSMCYLVCPEVFQLSDEDGHAYVVSETVPDALAGAVRSAAQSCPEQAIMIRDDGGL